METKASILNIKKICRVCLLEYEQMYSIYSELYDNEEITEDVQSPCIMPCIYKMLISISSIKVHVDDGLPALICTKCVNTAHTCFKFQKQCNQSQIILEKYLHQCRAAPEEKLSTNDSPQDVDGRNVDLLQSDDSFLDKSGHMLSSKIKIEATQLPEIAEEETEINDEVALDEPTSTEKIYSCKQCDKKYKHASSLSSHKLNHASEKRYTCLICNKSFKQSNSLFHHNRSHTDEKPYKCKLCGKQYRQCGTLTAHMRVHTGQKPFLCSICGRGFRQAADLGYHMRTHTNEKPYMCNVCGKTMSIQSNFVQHMRSHTGEKPFKCSLCEKAFPSTTRLKRHEIVHTTLKPFTCEVCKKSFNRRSTLMVHSKIHTDERAHVCQICGNSFIQAHSLRSHLLTHSSENGVKSA